MPKRTSFNRVCIVGVGLIGGSIGLALRKRGLAGYVTGVVRRPAAAKRAVSVGALDRATFDLASGVRDADLVILCTPVETILRQLRQIAPHLKPGAVVTDVGSSKGRIVHEASRVLKRNLFVGSHPMAGSEKRGIEHADSGLFEGEICFLTGAHPKLGRFWRSLGAHVVRLTPERHDRWTALASHLPHVLAFSLFADPAFRKDFPGRLNPSARNLARIARGASPVWSGILLSNRFEILAAIGRFRRALLRWEGALRHASASAVDRLIGSANETARRVQKGER